MIFQLLPEAIQEGEQTARWYEERRSGYGNRFLAAIADVRLNIEQNPRLYPRVYGRRSSREIRVAALKRFPYKLVYEIVGNDCYVLAIAHHSRRPFYWRKRRP